MPEMAKEDEMTREMALEILVEFEETDDDYTIALNSDNSEWKSGRNWGSDWADVTLADFLELLRDEGLEDLAE